MAKFDEDTPQQAACQDSKNLGPSMSTSSYSPYNTFKQTYRRTRTQIQILVNMKIKKSQQVMIK
jgi:hypothetical protein